MKDNSVSALDGKQFLDDILRRLNFNGDIFSIFNYFMFERYRAGTWVSDIYAGSNFEYTVLVTIEEIVEIIVAFGSGNEYSMIDELGDLFGLYEALRTQFYISRFPVKIEALYIDPLSLIKKLTKTARFQTDDNMQITSAITGVGQFIQSHLGYKFYLLPNVKVHNILYFVMSSAFIKGVRRFCVKYNLSVDEYVPLFCHSLRNNLSKWNRLSKVALRDFDKYVDVIRSGKKV